jgi:tetratricopeptide (TPR) repeat protein
LEEVFRNCVVLGVLPDASISDVKSANRSLAQQWHPDKVQGDDRRRREAEVRLRIINRAYRSLMSAKRGGDTVNAVGAPPQPGTDPVTWRQKLAESGRVQNNARDKETPYSRALELHFRGLECYSRGRYREAVSAFTQSVCLVQNNPEAFTLLGRAHRRLGQPAKAAAAYQKAIQIDPESDDSRYELGESLLSLGDAAAAARQADLLQPRDPELALLLRESTSKLKERRDRV